MFKKIRKPTTYDMGKKVKMDNFTYLNTFVEHHQTVLIGDSITEMYNITDLFMPYMKHTGIAVYNRGISGDTSDQMAKRLYKNALVIEPRNLVILIGTNDMGFNLPLEETAINIDAMLTQTQQTCPNTHIIVQAIYPVCALAGVRSNKKIGIMNEQIKEVCMRHKVVFLDLTEPLSTSKKVFNNELTYDGLHPNAKGFKVITDHLVPLLK